MDCCTKDERDCCKKLDKTNMKGGKAKMEKRIWLWVVIAVLFVATLFLTFKVGNIGATGNVIQSAGSVAQSAGSAMVGGC